MAEGAGVPSAAGVATLESEGASPEPLAAAAGVSGDSFVSTISFGSLAAAGDSSFVGSSSKSSRSWSDGTESVTTRLGLPPDFRRPSEDFVGGAILMCCVVMN